MSYKFAILGCRGYPSTYGGFETLVRHLAPYLHAQGDEVTVYCREGRFGVTDRDGIRCVQTHGIYSNALSTLTFGASASWDARRSGYDAVLVLNVANGFYLPWLRRRGIPTVVNVDGIEWERGKWSALGRKVFLEGARRTAACADSIVVDSHEIGRRWRTQFGRASRYIPYGGDVPDELGTDRLDQLGIRQGRYALAVARLVPENNVELLLEAVSSLPADIDVVVVGTPAVENQTSRLLEDLSRTDARVRWLGHVSDQSLLAQLWAHCLVYAHGHSVGGTNPALIQALGYGAATIALDTPYNAEVLANPDQLYPPDASALAAMIKQLGDDGDLRERLRTAGRQTVRERFTWDAVLRDYRDALIAATLGGRRAGPSVRR